MKQGNETKTTRLGAPFYIILAVLTVAVLGLLAVWAWTKRNVFLYVALGIFPLYLIHLIYHLATAGKRAEREKERRSAFLTLARDPAARLVHLTYLGGERRIYKPSSSKKDYRVEFYTGGADEDALKRHLWFDLPEEEEARLKLFLVGSAEIAYPFLADISGKRVYAQAAFVELAKGNPYFVEFFKANEVASYGE